MTFSRIHIVFDEAARLIKDSSNAIASWIPLVRESNVSLDLMTQYMAHGAVAHEIIANCRNKRIGVLTDPADFSAMTSAMACTSEQTTWLRRHLQKPGQFAMQNSGLGVPFLFNVPLLDVPKLAPAHDCLELDQLPVISDPRLVGWQPNWAGKKQEFAEAGKPQLIESNSSPVANANSRISLSSKERRLLEAIVLNRKTPKAVSFFASNVGMAKATVNAVRKSLVAKKLILEQKTQGGRGRPSILLAPTPLGVEIIEGGS